MKSHLSEPLLRHPPFYWDVIAKHLPLASLFASHCLYFLHSCKIMEIAASMTPPGGVSEVAYRKPLPMYMTNGDFHHSCSCSAIIVSPLPLITCGHLRVNTPVWVGGRWIPFHTCWVKLGKSRWPGVHSHLWEDAHVCNAMPELVAVNPSRYHKLSWIAHLWS